jgi:phage shock protein C
MKNYHNEKISRYKKLYLDKENSYIYGVCAGIADYMGIDPVIVRIITVVSLIFGVPFVIIGYFLLAWLLEYKPSDMYETKEESDFWKGVRTEPSNTIRDIRYKFRDIERRLRAAEAHVTSSEYNLKRQFSDLEKE